MIVAGFDIATNTGAAIFDGDVLVRCSAFRPEGDTDAEIFHGFRSWFRGLVRHYGVEHIAIEQALVTDIRSKKTGKNPVRYRTYLLLYGLRAIAIQSAHGLQVPVLEVNQSTWRKKFTGNHRATKEQTLALVREKYDDSVKSLDAAEAVGVAFYLKTKLATNRVSETSEVGDAA
jgi:Holliday junction resolvasome RuvABC endonuclease subunit